MTEPAHAFQSAMSGGNSSTLQQGVIWHFVLSGDAHNASEAAHNEGVKFVFLSSIQRPGLTVIQVGHDKNFVDLDFGLLGQLAIGPHPVGQSGHGGSLLANVLVELLVNAEVVCNG